MTMPPRDGEAGAGCVERRLLIQADHDGELDAAASAALAAHVETCPYCAALRDRLILLSSRLRAEVAMPPAPETLRAPLLQALAAAPQAGAGIPPARLPRRRAVLSFGAGAAMAAMAASVAWLALPRGAGDDGDLLDLHLRALQPGHLTDVVSTDQHTVKPWFDGRIDFAPAVKDLAASGFPLIGGRLDVLQGRPVAVLVYGRARHVIDLVVAPEAGAPLAAAEPTDSTLRGYGIVQWSNGGMRYAAISDVARADLAEFVRLWRAMP
jgi:anti-sigma factor RsiW